MQRALFLNLRLGYLLTPFFLGGGAETPLSLQKATAPIPAFFYPLRFVFISGRESCTPRAPFQGPAVLVLAGS